MEENKLLLEENYRPNTPDVIHEIIDGEAVMISMEKGYYYSLNRIGSVIWDLLDQGMTLSRIIIDFQQQYAGSKTTIEEGVHDFILKLQTEELIVPVVRPERSEGPVVQGASGAIDDGAKQNDLPFAVPVLHKYTDMEDLLMLDPIHEVADTGWPQALND